MSNRLRRALIILIGAGLFIPLRMVPGQASTSARHTILFLGDGMGPNHVLAGAYYVCGATPCLSFESFANQTTMTTDNALGRVTDSAASVTAMATGVKVKNGVLSVLLPGDGSELPTVLEAYRNRRMSTGLVTTSHITDASPAGFGAHDRSRTNTGPIFADYMAQTRPEVLLGAGGGNFDPTVATQHGYTLVTDRNALLGLDPEVQTRVTSSFSTASFPSLPEMTETALKVLDNDADGFFLFVAHNGIDGTSAANATAAMVRAVAELSSAVQKAVDWVDQPGDGVDWTNTLVVVLADHETGGITSVTNRGAGNIPIVRWSATSHTDKPVPVYARGQGAEQITNAQIDNTDIFGILSPVVDGNACLTVNLTRGEDTWLDSAAPDTAHGSDTVLVADSSPDNGTLVKWDLSSLPDVATVQAVSITVHLSDEGDQSSDGYELYALRRDWSQAGATWNSYDGATAWGAAGAQDIAGDVYGDVLGATPGDGAPPVDLTILLDSYGVAQIQRWVNGSEPNYGFAIVDYKAGGDNLRLASFESATPPRLSLTYCDAFDMAGGVWYDRDQDGIRAGGEAGQPGMVVNLCDGDSDAIVQTTVTDPNGRYGFARVVTGSYYVGFGQPGAYLFSPMDRGSDEAHDSDVDPATGLTSAFAWSAGGAPSLDLDAGIVSSLEASLLFQEGVAPSSSYAGTADTTLSENTPTVNYGDSATLWADGDDPEGSGQDLAALLRWDISAVPPGSLVEEASITVNVTKATTQEYSVYEVKPDWAESQATWILSGAASQWQAAGAQGALDRGSAVLGVFAPATSGTYELSLNSAGLALIQAWVDDALRNHGVIIASSVVTDGVAFDSGEASIAADRPRLNVRYRTGGPLPTPTDPPTPTPTPPPPRGDSPWLPLIVR